MDSIAGKPIPLSTNLVGAKDPSDLLQPLSVDSGGNLLVSATLTDPTNGTPGTPVPVEAKYVAGTDGTNLRGLKTDANGELQVDVLSSALPAGAATETTLSGISAKLPATLGSTTKSGSLSVTLASDQEPVSVVAQGTVDANNSTVTPLAGGGVFTGTSTDIRDYATVSVLVASDVPAAAGGLSLQFSIDGTNWDHTHNYDFAGGNLSYNISAEARYFRIVYTNDATAQAYFRLQTVLRREYVMPSQYTIGQTVSDLQLATAVKSVIYGKTTGGGGGYVAVKVNPSGALTTEVSGTVTANAGTGNFTVVQPTGSNLHVVVDSAPTTTVTGTVAATQSGTWSTRTEDGSGNAITSTGNALDVNVKNTSLSVNLNAGSNLIGQVGIDQTTPGTTNAVSLAQVGATTVATGNGVVGSGVQRVAIASDNSAFSVNANQAGTWTVQPGNTPNTTAWLVTQDGKSVSNASVYKDYAAGSVTTSAYTELVASTSAACSEVEIFDSSGEGMILATGAAGSEVDQIFIFPGGNGRVPLKIAASTRVAIKAKTATASNGFLMINFYA